MKLLTLLLPCLLCVRWLVPAAVPKPNTLVTVANDAEYQPGEFYDMDEIADHAVK